MIIANIVGGLAILAMIISSFFKRKNTILGTQIVAHILLAVSEGLLKAYSSIVQEGISILRNVTVIAKKNNKIINIILILLGLIVGILINVLVDNNSWIGYLPIIANLEYSIVTLSNKTSVNALKISFFISGVLWAIFFFVIGNYTSGALNLVSAFMALGAVIKSFFKNKENKSENLGE